MGTVKQRWFPALVVTLTALAVFFVALVLSMRFMGVTTEQTARHRVGAAILIYPHMVYPHMIYPHMLSSQRLAGRWTSVFLRGDILVDVARVCWLSTLGPCAYRRNHDLSGAYASAHLRTQGHRARHLVS